MVVMICPWCGRRVITEFHYGGEASHLRPRTPERLSDSAWADHLFNRDNPKGMAREFWYHAHGCRRWFTATRDTRTNKVLGSEP